MKRAYTLSLSIFFSFCSIAGIAQSTKVPIDYLQNPGPISFDKISYRLNWSSHPSDNFYKQEYLVKGDDENRFKTMLLLDVITGSDKLQDIVAAKIAELQQMKQSNPAVSYETFDNKTSGEYMIDFLITQNSADGKSVAIAERNVYRYKIYTDKAGKKMIVAFRR